MATPKYDESSIKSLEWNEHIRTRPGMYIGKLGDGQSPDDGIYVLVKEIMDNSIDEFVMGAGKKIDVEINEHSAHVRDYGRGIPLGKVVECVSKINTGGKYDSEAFQKSVGLNGVGTKAVNALSSYFVVASYRDGKCKKAEFKCGKLIKEHPEKPSSEKNGTEVYFEPDKDVFKGFRFLPAYMEERIWNYAYLNTGLSLSLNGKIYESKNGLFDLLSEQVKDTLRYPIIHCKGKDIEIALTHTELYGEHYFSFVNGQHTTQGGTHQAAFREGIVKGVRDFFKKDFDASDVRNYIAAAVSIRIQEPVFESQTKTKLGSAAVSPGGAALRGWMVDFIAKEIDNCLHKNPETAKVLQERIAQNERERKEIAGVRKLANERAKKAAVHNRKLRDCKVHLTDQKSEKKRETMIFITEGDSASGSITTARDVQTQAVFSLRGKPLNTYGIGRKVVYENEEFNLLQHALDIENGLESLRYNKVIIATDADVDGMHIRLLMVSFFLQFFPELVEQEHLYILQTPLFRVRNKKETIYCYNEGERDNAQAKLGNSSETTRFKGLGEIDPGEFGLFIGDDMRLESIIMPQETTAQRILGYYMGSNTSERTEHVINSLRAEAVAQL
ncbi:MAG: type IIA DNA topoisomerase subunit B [Fibromonadaceae bacterium]|jgi:topoisomerase-4 subunit B|nr:type IIA DNA topoisomerase subunit B [Fibromonadaceae bacterium]